MIPKARMEEIKKLLEVDTIAESVRDSNTVEECVALWWALRECVDELETRDAEEHYEERIEAQECSCGPTEWCDKCAPPPG